MDSNIEKKIVELGNKYLPLLDKEIELTEKQLYYTRNKNFEREKNKSFVERIERE